MTDADLVLGYLNPEYFLGGRLRLDRRLAEEAIARAVAAPLFGGDSLAAAEGIRRVADAQMADLIRKATIERGHDLRDFVLMAYGGAGPVHCCAYAEEAGIDRIVVPHAATVHSALSAAVAELRHTRRLSAPMVLPGDPARARAAFSQVAEDALSTLGRQEIHSTQVALERWAEMRYRRQMHVVRVPVTTGELDAGALARLADAFEARYARLYGASANYREAGIEIVSFGVDAVAKTAQPELAPLPREGTGCDHAAKARRPVLWSRAEGLRPTPVLDGARLRPGNRFAGPAIAEYEGTTLAVPAGWSADVDEYRNVHLTRGARPA